ncbi:MULTISPECIES: hypothetical protein [Corynebacterium]|nr:MULTISPECIES: hypothetical protein [Corynebacterium]
MHEKPSLNDEVNDAEMVEEVGREPRADDLNDVDDFTDRQKNINW